jgi:hypothetical protein
MWKTILDENPVTDGPLLLFTHIVGANGPACPYLSPEIRYPTFSLSPRATVQIKIFNTPAEFREWLEENHDRVSEIWLGFYNKRTDKRSTTYREALDEALCFGWIDGVRKSVDETTYKQRFTPRRPNSYWSAVNIRRADELARLGRMSAREQKHSSNGPAILGSILSSHDLRNCLLSISGSSKQTGRHGSSSGPRLRGTSGHPPSGL